MRDRLEECVLHLVERPETVRRIALTTQTVVQFLLRALQGRDVDVDALPELGSPMLVPVQRGLLANPHQPTVARDHPILDAQRRTIFERAARGRFRGLDIIGMRESVPQVGIREPFRGRVAEEPVHLRADEDGGEVCGVVIRHLVDIRHRGDLLDEEPVTSRATPCHELTPVCGSSATPASSST